MSKSNRTTCKDCGVAIDKGNLCANCLSTIRRNAALKLYKDNPELREVRSIQLKERYEDPEEREKTRQQQLERWSSEEKREFQRQKQLKFIEEHPDITESRREASKNYWKNEEARKKQSSEVLNRWQDEEYKNKQSEARKGNKNAENLRGHKQSEEHIESRAISLKNYHKDNPDAIKGANNPHWNGGTSFLPYTPEFNSEFKQFIRTRQNHKCADIHLGNCSEDNCELPIHHIDRDRKNSTPHNCIALCVRHHGMSHNEETRIRHRKYLKDNFSL